MDKMIMYEDKEILVVHKPAGLATQTARLGQADLVSRLKNYRADKGESTYIGVIHRLDQPVEGLLVFAKNQKAAGQLGEQLNSKQLQKKYCALVEGDLSALSGGELIDLLQKDSKTNLSKVVPQGSREAKEARLLWRTLKSFKTHSLVEVELMTGRHHQIRVQLSNAGMPLLGDVKYGTETSIRLSKELRLNTTALFADQLSFLHPASNERKSFKLPYPKEWQIDDM